MPHTPHTTTEGEIKEIWERLTAGEASIKSAHHRIDGFESLTKSVTSLALSTNQLATETKALREDYKLIDDRIASLEGRPQKRYDTFITAIITALCSGVAGYLLNVIITTIKG